MLRRAQPEQRTPHLTSQARSKGRRTSRVSCRYNSVSCSAAGMVYQLDDRQGHGARFADHLDRVAILKGKRRVQYFMAGDDRLHGLPQGGHLEGALYPECLGNVIEGAVRPELIKETAAAGHLRGGRVPRSLQRMDFLGTVGLWNRHRLN